LNKLFLEKRILVCGAGKMGSALLKGWISQGVAPKLITVIEPSPSPWLLSLTEKGLILNPEVAQEADIFLIAVKPQMVSQAIHEQDLKKQSKALFVSIVAGTTISKLIALLGIESEIIRVMPNTPVSIRKGISCLIGNKGVSEEQLKLAESLFSVVGKTIRLNSEEQMDVVTAISGSGPAYVFYLIETLILAGVNLGLDRKLAESLAVLTVSGSGALAEISDCTPDILRKNVTSPNGTTESALKILMNNSRGLSPLMTKTIAAAVARGRELASLTDSKT